MTTNLQSAAAPNSPVPDYMTVLTQAAATLRRGSDRAARPAASEVVRALLQAEKAAKQQHLIYPVEPLIGKWRLCFTTPGKVRFKGDSASGKGFYVPQIAPAQISFLPAQSEQTTVPLKIGNQIQLGTFLLRFEGPAKYLGKKNILAFDFTQIQISLFDRPLYTGAFRSGKAQAGSFEQQSIAKLPFFAFFLVTENFIAARGRGGGLALWVREA